MEIEVKEPGKIYRRANQILFHIKELKQKGFEKLLEIEKNQTGFDLIPNAFKLDENDNICTLNSAWFIFKQSKFENKMSKYKINQGDIIRIGRITTRIKNIYFSGASNNINIGNTSNLIEVQEQSKNKLSTNAVTESNNSNIKKSLKKNNSKGNNKINKICRICYMEEDDESNPLVQPCICSGSMKYIHLNCLKHWINTRSFDKIESNELCSIYIIKPVECELCKTKFPDFIRHNGKLFSLLDFQYEYKNYLTLESLTLDKNKNKFLYVICLENNKKIKLGRGHDSDILLSDISVSRIHCVISTENKNVYIEDNNSKFGTLILIQSPSIQMVENLPFYFQVGRTFFNCRYKKPQKLFQCCGVSERPNIFYYHKQNKMQVNEKTKWTVKTEVDFDDDEEFLEDSNVNDINNNEKNNEDNNSIDLIDEENKDKDDDNKKMKNNIGDRGTMVIPGNEVDFTKNIPDNNKENKMNNNNDDNNNKVDSVVNKRNIEIDANNVKINDKNIKSVETERKEEDGKSESIVIEDEKYEKNKDNLVTNEEEH